MTNEDFRSDSPDPSDQQDSPTTASESGFPSRAERPRRKSAGGDPDDGMSSLARGWLMAHRIMGICLEMILPILLGWWIDDRYGTDPWLLILGAAIGLTLGLVQLIHISKSSPS